MTTIDVITTEVNEARYTARLSEQQLKDVIVKAVAEAAGFRIGPGFGTVARCHLTSCGRSNGLEYQALCEIVVSRTLTDEGTGQ